MHTDDYFELLRNQPAMTEQEVRAIVDAYPSDETTIQPTAQALGWLWVLLLFPLLIWPAAHNLLKNSEPVTTIQSNHPTATTTIPALSDAVVVAPSIPPLPAIGDSTKKRTIAIAAGTSPSLPDSLTISAPFSPVVRDDSGAFHYGFPVGRRLVYRKISDAVDTGSGQSDLFTVEAALEVQGYDSSGNAQVLITILNERLTDRKQSPEISLSDPSPNSIVVRPQITYQTSIPILQAVFTPQGKYVSGIAVKYSAEHERSLQPPANTKNVMVIRASPESIIRHEAEKWFQELPSFITLTPGRNWVDTVFEPHNVVSMNVPSRETKQNEVGYRIISTYTVLSDTLINSIPCTHLLINAVKREEGTTWNSQFFSTHHLFLRKTDTVLMRQESEYTSNGGGVQPGAWTKITKELIAEE